MTHHIEGTGPSEPKTASEHIKEVEVKTFDVNELFTLPHSTGTKPIIKIRKNASTDRCKGSKYRRRTIMNTGREETNSGQRRMITG